MCTNRRTVISPKVDKHESALSSSLFIFMLICCWSIGTGHAFGDSVNLEQGLVAQWPLDEGGGTTAYDVSGNENHGIIYGSPSSVPGVSGSCYDFDGEDDYIEIPGVDDFYFANQSLTFVAWVTVADNPNYYRHYISLGDSGDQRPSINLAKSRNGYWDGCQYFENYDNSVWIAAAKSDDTGAQIPKDEFRMLCGVYYWDTKKIRLYVDGELQVGYGDLQTFDMNNATQLTLRIGAWCELISNTSLQKGCIDEVRIYDRALSQEEVSYLYHLTLGTTIHVDDDNTAGPWDGSEDFPYQYIQDGIDNAVNGQTVRVMPGTYVETIDFLGKAILVHSAEGYQNTIIDGDEAGSVVTFNTGEGNGSILDGFTIQNGTGTDVTPGGSHERHCGGGIFCYENVAPIIRNNRVRYNNVDYDGAGVYGALLNDTVENETIQILNNIVYDNVCIADGQASVGGGMCFSMNSQPILISNNIVFENECYGAGEGGGMAFWDSPDVRIINCTIYGNSVNGNAGAIQIASSTVDLSNTIIWNNSAPAGMGDSIYMYDPQGHGDPTLNVDFSMVQGGEAGINVVTGTLNWNAMNVNEAVENDPMFVDPDNANHELADFHLMTRAPCINRGTDQEAPLMDFEGNVRPIMGAIDIGADEYTGVFSLASDKFTLSAGTDGSVAFGFDLGVEYANCRYCLTGTFSETLPGTVTPADTVLRANWDFFNDFILFPMINTPVFDQFLGELDAQGQGSAAMDTFGSLDPAIVGETMHFALTTYKPFAEVSNPVPLVFEQ